MHIHCYMNEMDIYVMHTKSIFISFEELICCVVITWIQPTFNFKIDSGNSTSAELCKETEY